MRPTLVVLTTLCLTLPFLSIVPLSSDSSHSPEEGEAIMESLPMPAMLGSVTASGDGQETAQEQVLVWSSKVFRGALTEKTLKALLANGRGYELESRLSAPSKAALRTCLQDTEDALVANAIAYETQVDVIKSVVTKDPTRHIRVKLPRETSVEYQQVQDLTRAMRGEGAVWGDIVDGGEVYSIMYWSEWPSLRCIVEKRYTLINDRQMLVGRWIAKALQENGKQIFQ